MSLAIDIDKVQEVLLPDGKWHEVADQSFEMDSYEYLRASETRVGDHGASVRLKGGEEKLVSAIGARWVERDSKGNERRVFCPVTAIQAVAYVQKKKKKKK
jgi:hypothetical protein